MDTRCQAKTKSGRPCNAKPAPGDTLCPWHSPQWIDRRKAWSIKGGQNKATAARTSKLVYAARVKTIPTLQRLLSKAIDDALAGEVPPALLNAVASASKTIVDLG